MKKLLIATTALVATAGMASADITISGHAAAGIHSGLDNKAPTAAIAVADATKSCKLSNYGCKRNSTGHADTAGVQLAAGSVIVSGTDGTAAVTTAVAAKRNYAADGIYSNAGVDFTMTGATDNGISFSAAVNIDAGTGN